MADMCGPSNALSSFQKHTTIDRTLQQDRLIARQSPSQGFRSTGPNTRQLDLEFEAFQAGNLPLDHTLQQTPHFPQHSFQAAPSPANWATDFQRLNISSPGPQIQQRHDAETKWRQDFVRQQNQAGVPISAQAQGQQNSGFVPQYSPMGMGTGMGLGQYSGFQQPQDIYQQQQQQHPVENFDDAAFEQAFEAAAAAEIESHAETAASTQSQHTETLSEQLVSESRSQDIDTQASSSTLIDATVQPQTLEEVLRSSSPQPNNGPLDQPFIGSDTIVDPSKPVSEQQQDNDPDALARTAQHLINSLSGDTRQKLQDSEFMKLMRGFATGQKGIVGEEVVEKDGLRAEGETKQLASITVATLIERLILSTHLLKICMRFTSPGVFIRTPSTVRNLLLHLLHIDSALREAGSDFDVKSLSVDDRTVFESLRQTLERIVTARDVNGLPSVRVLAMEVLRCLKTLEGRTVVGMDGIGSVLDDVRRANREVETFYYWSGDTGGWDEGGGVGAYMDGVRAKESAGIADIKEEVESLLGYRILGGQVGKVHMQRAGDILGPQVGGMLDG